MSHQYESTQGTAKEPTIEYSDSTLTSSDGSNAYGDKNVYGSNPNPHNQTADFGRDTHVNQDSLVRDRADGKDRLGNDPNTTHSTMTGSSADGNLSGTTTTQAAGGHGHGLSGLETAGAAGLGAANAQTGTGLGHGQNLKHTHNTQNNPSYDSSHVHNSTCGHDLSRDNDSKTGHGGSAAAVTSGKVAGAGTFDTQSKTNKNVFDGPTHGATGTGVSATSGGGHGVFDANTTRSGAFGGADVGGSGTGSGIKSDYDALGNRVGPGHKEGHNFLDENHSEKIGFVDKIKSKIGMNSGDDRHGDFAKDNVDQHGSTHAGGQGGAGRI